MDQKVHDVVVVGGGLSGLILAREIHSVASKRSWRLLDARHKLGGRLENDSTGNSIDLGGAWIWPPHQNCMMELIKSLDGLETFDQPDDPSSTRIVGGAAKIIETLVQHLPTENIQLNAPVVGCKHCLISDLEGGGTNNDKAEAGLERIVKLEFASGEEMHAIRVVFAVPPKLLSMHVKFDPPLSDAKAESMSKSRTWMAGVTKVALVYNSTRFWPLDESNRGLRPGPTRPAFQVYDSSPHESSTLSALTFFTLSSLGSGVNHNDTNAQLDDRDDDKALARQCADQICASFSPSARRNYPSLVKKIKNFDSFHVKRWPHEKYISEDRDPKGISPHPKPNPELARSEWDGSLLFAGTEADLSSPGLMEGAVSSALRVMSDLRQMWHDDD